MKKNKMKLISISLEIIILFSTIYYGNCRYNDLGKQLISKEKSYKIEKLAIYKEKKRIQADLPKVYCWGDSLTQGVGGNGINYPDELSKIIHLETKNFGVGGETAESIAMRQGAVALYVEGFNIPESTEKTEIKIKDSSGNYVNLLGDAGLNPCDINGVKGNVEVDVKNKKYYFSRSENGSGVKVENNTMIDTYSKENVKKNDICILFIGTNNKPDTSNIQNIIDIQKNMLKFANNDKYIIVGLTSKIYMPEVEKVNSVMQAEYGDKFLDVRKYLIDHGLEDAGFTPTKEDIDNIENGDIPSSLRSDEVHGNEYFYKIIAMQIYKKIIELNYLDEEQKKYLQLQ